MSSALPRSPVRQNTTSTAAFQQLRQASRMSSLNLTSCAMLPYASTDEKVSAAERDGLFAKLVQRNTAQVFEDPLPGPPPP